MNEKAPEISINREEIKNALYAYVDKYRKKNKISCPESIHQDDELNLDAPHFMEECMRIIGAFEEGE